MDGELVALTFTNPLQTLQGPLLLPGYKKRNNRKNELWCSYHLQESQLGQAVMVRQLNLVVSVLHRLTLSSVSRPPGF